MTASNGHIADVVEGIVDSANDRGDKVGGAWRNVSRGVVKLSSAIAARNAVSANILAEPVVSDRLRPG